MPLTDKGKKIKRAMKAHYGPGKGERVFHAAKNKGSITGVEPDYRVGTLPGYQEGTGGLYGGAWKGLNPEGQKQAQQQIQSGNIQDNQARRDVMTGLAGQYGATGAGAGAGGAGGGGGGGAPASSTSVSTGAGMKPEGQMNQMAEFGQGLMDPGSDMSQRWMEEMREQVGRGTDASQRAAAYQAAQQGFGTGASPELLQMQGDIGVAGQEAAGDAASDFMLKAPQLGVQAAGTALGSGVGMRGQDLQSKLASEQNALQREQMNAQMQMQQRGLDVQRELGLQDSAYGRELAALYGGQAAGGPGGGLPAFSGSSGFSRGGGYMPRGNAVLGGGIGRR